MNKHLVGFLAILWIVSTGHSFKVDSYGCHNNSSLNVYECHTGKLAGRSYQNPDGKSLMLKDLAAQPTTISITGSATLTWTPTTDESVVGYKLYWAVEPDKWQTPITIGKVSELKLDGVLKGATYYFAITAFNANNEESEKSNVVSKTF